MPRCVLIVLMGAALVGCGYDHTASWTGVRASGSTWTGRALYKRVAWAAENLGDLGDAPGFSVGLPDGSMLTPDQFTVEILDAKARPRPVYFTYPSGKLTVLFDEFDRPTVIQADGYPPLAGRPSGSSEGGIAVGNREGSNLVQLPATRAQLIAVFGEPTLEDPGPSNLYWPGLRAMASFPRAGGDAEYFSVDWSMLDKRWPYYDLRTGGGPGFSIRLPDGTVLTPDKVTVETLRTQAPPPENTGSHASFRYSNGQLVAAFDQFNQLTRIEIVEGWNPRKGVGSDIAIGNREGTKLVALPANRDELVELFGEPTSETSTKRPVCLGPC